MIHGVALQVVVKQCSAEVKVLRWEYIPLMALLMWIWLYSTWSLFLDPRAHLE